MWAFTTIGFFSVTQCKEDPTLLQVRARVRGDLDNLRTVIPELTETIELPGRDYPYRGYINREDFARGYTAMIMGIDYSNFKNEVMATEGQGLEREQLYHDVWHVMNGAERKLAEKKRANASRKKSRLSDAFESKLGFRSRQAIPKFVDAPDLDNIIEDNSFSRIHSEPLTQNQLEAEMAPPSRSGSKSRKKR